MAISYLSIKYIHVTAVTLSIALFLLRAGWMLYSPQRLQRRWVRTVPHVIDTALLLSGAWLAWQLGRAGVGGWLPAKLAALVAYIVLGAVALRYGRARGLRIGALGGALLAFAYMVAVAVTKSPFVVT
jgi:uncharacterized membrane protein SirB2